MYIEHPYYYDGKYYAHVDGEMVEISREVAYAMNNFYKKSRPKCIEKVNDEGVVERKVREIPYCENDLGGNGYTIEEIADFTSDVEGSALDNMERQEVHKMISKLNPEERMIIYAIFFENKTQKEVSDISGMSRQAVGYKLKNALNKMRYICKVKKNKKNFKKVWHWGWVIGIYIVEVV